MNATMFLILLSAFSVISSLVTALFVGGGGTAVYYQLNAIPFSANNIIYMILMGLASGLVSMVGFDKVKQAIEQIAGKRK